MENASKALLIAGAILICILLIAVGMYVFSSANNLVESSVADLSQRDKELYNATISKYVGENKRGTEVKEMITAIISQNDKNAGKTGQFIKIKVGESISKMMTADLKADMYKFYDDDKSANNSENLNTVRPIMRKMSSKISSGKTYNVEDVQEDGLITEIIILDKTASDTTAGAKP